MSITIGRSNLLNPIQNGVDIYFGDGTNTFDYYTNKTDWMIGSLGGYGKYALPRGWKLFSGVATTSTGYNDSFSFPVALSFVGPMQLIVYNYGGSGNPPTAYPVMGMVSVTSTGFTVNCKRITDNTYGPPYASYVGGVSFAWVVVGY